MDQFKKHLNVENLNLTEGFKILFMKEVKSLNK